MSTIRSNDERLESLPSQRLLFKLNLELEGQNKTIQIHENDDLVEVATRFTQENGLDREMAIQVYQLIKKSKEMH